MVSSSFESRLGLGCLLLGLVGFLLLFRFAFGRRALSGGAVPVLAGVALAPPAAVVRRVEPRPLEVDRGRIQDLDQGRGSADLTLFRRRIAHPLEELEGVSVGAAVLVSRHREEGKKGRVCGKRCYQAVLPSPALPA